MVIEITEQQLSSFIAFLKIVVLHCSETAASVGSDDEASNAATEGSTLRTSPAEQAEGAGSESGGSGVDSIGGASGRSSNYGDNIHSSPPKGDDLQTSQPEPSTSAMSIQEDSREEDLDDTNEMETIQRLHILR